MTFRLIHTHLTSFYSGCLRKAWYTKFAEVRGGRMKKYLGPYQGIVYSNQPHGAVKCAR